MGKKQKRSSLLRTIKDSLYMHKRRVRRAQKKKQQGYQAWFALNIAVLLCGLEAAYVQIITTSRNFDESLLTDTSFLFLFVLDCAFPLCIALLSRRFFALILPLQSVLTCILLHYTIFFYNPLTLSTIYHSLQGVGALGTGIFMFVRWKIIAAVAFLCIIKLILVRLSHIPDEIMPAFWRLRGITAVLCITVIFCTSTVIYAKTGLSALWVDSRGHRTATERRLEDGTKETVRSLGYTATWLGEFLSGTYADLELIYAEAQCTNLDTLCNSTQQADFAVKPSKQALGDQRNAHPPAAAFESMRKQPGWNGLPVPTLGSSIILMQVESLDFAVLPMQANNVAVMPFLDALSKKSLQIKVFAPHKVGSCNSDYELLNSRVADQNVIYYDYITSFPDSLIAPLAKAGYQSSVFHGLEGDLFSLRRAYTAMGFTDLFFKEELLLQGYAETSYILRQVADKDVFACALEQLRANSLQAQFIVTVDSHIPFIKPVSPFDTLGGSFAKYISALNVFDRELELFYSQLPEGTVLILWGDHGSDVEYPSAFESAGRCVPFIVHVKGDTTWVPEQMRGAPQQKRISSEVAHKPTIKNTGRRNDYTLCEMSYYLQRIVEQAVQRARAD